MLDRSKQDDPENIISLQRQLAGLHIISDRLVHPEVISVEDQALTDGVLEAAKETARTMRGSNSDYAMMQMLVKCCSSEKLELFKTLDRKINAEPELAHLRTYGLGVSAPDGFTLLHVAAAANNCRAIELLLKCNSLKAWVVDLQGRTPLHIAAV